MKFLDAMHYIGGNKNDKSIDDFLTLAMLLLEGYISTNYDYETVITDAERKSNNHYVQLAKNLHKLWKFHDGKFSRVNQHIQNEILDKSEINKVEDCIFRICAKGIFYCEEHEIKHNDRCWAFFSGYFYSYFYIYFRHNIS